MVDDPGDKVEQSVWVSKKNIPLNLKNVCLHLQVTEQ